MPTGKYTFLLVWEEGFPGLPGNGSSSFTVLPVVGAAAGVAGGGVEEGGRFLAVSSKSWLPNL